MAIMRKLARMGMPLGLACFIAGPMLTATALVVRAYTRANARRARCARRAARHTTIACALPPALLTPHTPPAPPDAHPLHSPNPPPYTLPASAGVRHAPGDPPRRGAAPHRMRHRHPHGGRAQGFCDCDFPANQDRAHGERARRLRGRGGAPGGGGG